MKLFPTVACLFALCASVSALEDRRKVPGNNPLYHCPGDLAGDAVEITNVDLSPNPPEKYEPISSLALALVTPAH